MTLIVHFVLAIEVSGSDNSDLEEVKLLPFVLKDGQFLMEHKNSKVMRGDFYFVTKIVT